MTAKQHDIVVWLGSEWTVHELSENGVALLRKHDDLELKNTHRVPVAGLPVIGHNHRASRGQ